MITYPPWVAHGITHKAHICAEIPTIINTCQSNIDALPEGITDTGEQHDRQ